MISPKQTIGAIVADNHKTAEVFHQFDIDFCCGGKKTLEQACQERHVNPEALISKLESVQQKEGIPSQNVNAWPIDYLADHIEHTHHRYVRESIPFLLAGTEKIAQVHGERHPELKVLKRQFELLAQDLLEHLEKEEKVLFPYVRALAKNAGPLPNSANRAIHVMEQEHEYAGALLDNIKDITDNYTPPADACTTYQVTFSKLAEFEEDLHWHIHLENNVLFPKVLDLEAQRPPVSNN